MTFLCIYASPGPLQAKAAEDPVAILQAAHEAASLSKVWLLRCLCVILLMCKT